MLDRHRHGALLALLLTFLGLMGVIEWDSIFGPRNDELPREVQGALERLDDASWHVRRRGQAELARLDRADLERVRQLLDRRASATQRARLDWLLRDPRTPATTPYLRLRDGRRVDGVLVQEGDAWVAIREGAVEHFDRVDVSEVVSHDVLVFAPSAREAQTPEVIEEARGWMCTLESARGLDARRGAAQVFVEHGTEAHLTWLEERIEAFEAREATPVEVVRWAEWAQRELHWKLYGVYE
ncbi:MAG: hypothetical protein H6834_09175 [Planctomycetes bacterium]|nr:hypothetical protein [Planctomycetota bacterium]